MTGHLTPRLSRRRALTLLAAGAGCALVGAATPGAAEAQVWRWRGIALGANAEMVLAHPDRALARRVTELAVAEIARLEAIFSLYRPDSALSRLNAAGHLDNPPPELVAILAAAKRYGELSGGAFDVTIQPLWRVFADHFAVRGADPAGPPQDVLARARALVDYRAISVESGRITFARAGMAVTLNGIAQGVVTDRIADLLADHGFDRVLVDIGELRAGLPPEGRSGWPLQLAGTAGDGVADLSISGMAVATSAPAGLSFGAGRFHHLIDPRGGGAANRWRQISVIAARAATADALSTALSVSDDTAADNLIAATRPHRVIQVTSSGQVWDRRLG